MILIDENKLRCGTLLMIGEDMGYPCKTTLDEDYFMDYLENLVLKLKENSVENLE